MIRAMRDWQRFLDEVSWFLAPGESASVGDSLPWPRGPVEGLPQLSRLLSEATVTPVSVEARVYELLAWGPSDSRRGWLCLPPEDSPVEGVHAIHQQLLSVCGGIVERFGEPTSWWNNQDEVLTASAAGLPLAPVLDDYAWLGRTTASSCRFSPTTTTSWLSRPTATSRSPTGRAATLSCSLPTTPSRG